MFKPLIRLTIWTSVNIHWKSLILIGTLAVVSFLAFFNLQYNPRPSHDEGASLTMARTIAEDGVYASRNSDGYQTFGAVQSVGPTVLLPIALSLKLLGVGLLQGRLAMAVFLLITTIIFLKVVDDLFGYQAALLATLLLLGSPGVNFLNIGRQALGEVPALGYFLGGYLLWSIGLRSGRFWVNPLAGLLVGAAMVTKSQYIPIGAATLIALIILDRFWYRQGNIPALLVLGSVAASCVAIWLGWQVLYYGADTFNENVAKLRLLADSTLGFRLSNPVDAFRYLSGTGSEHFYYFWGVPALVYATVLAAQRNRFGLRSAFPLLFTLIWLFYFCFLIIPWPQVAFAPMAISSLFVGKLAADLAQGIGKVWPTLRGELRRGDLAKASFTPTSLLAFGTLIALIVLVSSAVYQFQSIVRQDVLDREGREEVVVRSPRQLRDPELLAAFLNQNVDKGAIIETWERELAILTDHRYHFPDQVLLAKTHAATSAGGSRDYVMGETYFREHGVSYLVIGWYARWNGIYDVEYLAKHAELLGTIGDGVWRYDVYKLLS